MVTMEIYVQSITAGQIQVTDHHGQQDHLQAQRHIHNWLGKDPGTATTGLRTGGTEAKVLIQICISLSIKFHPSDHYTIMGIKPVSASKVVTY